MHFSLPLLFVIFNTLIYAVRNKWNYNCNAMIAGVFPTEKEQRVYGQNTCAFKGKAYDQVLSNIPPNIEKIDQVRKEVEETIPDDDEEALDAFLKFRKSVFARDRIEDFSQTEEEAFRDKMKLFAFAERKSLNYRVTKSFPFVGMEEPLNWLDTMHLLYLNFLKLTTTLYYIGKNHLRLAKDTSNKDYCNLLGKSLNVDNGWGKGLAENAFKLVFRCYDSFPYNEKASTMVWDLALLLVDFYVFTNFTSNGIGAQTVFRTLKEQELPFDSDMRLHHFLANSLFGMNDAHISYKVECYEQFTFVQPLFFQHMADDSTPWGLYITKISSPELQGWINSKIIHMDGQNSFLTVFGMANEFGKSHSGMSRYTLGFSRLFFDSASSDFRLDRGLILKRTTIPYRKYIVYSVVKPGSDYVYEFKVDWMIFKNPTLSDFNDQTSYWKNHCEAAPWTKIAKKSTTSLQRRSSSNLQKLPKARKRLNKRSPAVTYTPTSEGTTPVSLGPGFAFFIIKDDVQGSYGVLIIQTFDVSDIDSWFKGMRQGFLFLQTNGIKKFLLDLTANSGGVLCLAYSLLGVLSPSPAYPFPATNYTYGTRLAPSDRLMKISKCVEETSIKTSPFKLQCFTNLTSRSEFPNDATWESDAEIKPKIANGFISGATRFSPFLMDKCTLKSTPLLADVKMAFDVIIVITDGLCGSSCAIVAAYLQQSGCPTVILSPGDGNPIIPNAYSFAGGQVVNLNNIRDVARRSSCFDMIPTPHQRIDMTITYRGIFNLNDKRNPLEYNIFPANWRYEYAKEFALTFAARWKAALPKGIAIFHNRDDYATDYDATGHVFL